MKACRSPRSFGDYKQSTIQRRLAREMMLAKISDLGGFVRLLQKNREELDRLCESLLINVTDFFATTTISSFCATMCCRRFLRRATGEARRPAREKKKAPSGKDTQVEQLRQDLEAHAITCSP